MRRGARLPETTRRALAEGLRNEGAACVAELHPPRGPIRLVEVGSEGVRVVEVPHGTPMEAALEELSREPARDLGALGDPDDVALLGAAMQIGLGRRLRAARAHAVQLGWRAFHGVGEA